jgi:hypothetical protein
MTTSTTFESGEAREGWWPPSIRSRHPSQVLAFAVGSYLFIGVSSETNQSSPSSRRSLSSLRFISSP